MMTKLEVQIGEPDLGLVGEIEVPDGLYSHFSLVPHGEGEWLLKLVPLAGIAPNEG